MARKRGRRGRGVGLIRVRRLSGVGLGNLKNPNSFMGAAVPPAVGGGVAAAVTIGLRGMSPTNEMLIKAQENAPWVGLAAGALVSLGMYNMVSRAAGLASLAGTAAVAAAFVGSQMAASSQIKAGTAGVGAIVAEFSGARGRGTGAIVMESAARGMNGLGAYGDQVNLGNINANAFGTSFAV